VLKSLALSLALLFGLASQALAATWNVPFHYATIQLAIDNASTLDGDIITVDAGTYVLAAPISLNKDVTIDGAGLGSTFIQGSISLGGHFILISGGGAGATIQNITFDKTDKNGNQEIIALQANNVTVQNCNFTGEYFLGDPEVSRGFVISPSITGFLIDNCSFTNLRQPGYINPNCAGQISNCFVDQTRGWVLDGGAASNVIFNLNTWGTNAVDIAILVGTALGAPYDPLETLSANNDGAIFSDQRTYKAYNVNQDLSYNSATAIQDAVNAANPGDDIQVKMGTHNEVVIVSEEVTITGAGNGSNPSSNTVIQAATACTGTAFSISASNVTLKNMYVKNYGTGVEITALSNTAIEDLVIEDHCVRGISLAGSLMQDVSVIGTTINVTGAPGTIVGIRAGTAAGVDGLLIEDCIITNNNQGMAIFQSTTPSAFTDITIQNSTISNNAQKGLYFEKLENALLKGLTMNNNGTDATYGFNNGIDINLKHDNYSGITIQDCDITNSGVTGTATDPENPAAIAIKARDDSPSYNTIPATLDNVVLKNNKITGPQNGIRFGEFGKTNATPTNITLEKNDLSHAYGHKAIISRTAGNIALNCNWHGSTDIPTINSKFVTAHTGTINLNQFLSNGTDGNGAVGFQPSGTCLCPSGLLATNTTTNITYCSIQAAIDAPSTLAGHTITVAAGTYNEDVAVNKDLTIQGAGMNVCTVSGPIGGAGATFQVLSSGVTIDGFTITRDGNNTTDWNNPNLNIPGIAIQGQTVDAEIKNCRITGNRTGIDINDSDGNNIHNNIITFNRTGMILRNQTDNTLLNENEITDNWTLGVLFLDASGGSNVPVQQALNSSFNENNISGNWYGQIQDRQSGGSLPTPGTTNMKNFECNWYGTTSPAVTSTNSSEPGYAAQIPVAYGGSAVPPGGQPDVLGTASANLDYLLFLVSGTDDEPSTNGFQPTSLSCIGGCPGGGVVINENTNAIYCSIQTAINAATSGNRLKVKTGTYTESVTAVSKNIIFAPGNSPGCVTINGDFTLNGGDVLEMEIEGTTPCIQHDKFIINGVVTLGGATLTLPPSMYLAVDPDQIVLIENDGTDAVIGKFAQGNFATDGQNSYYINYTGGTDNNDVVLTKCCGALVDIGIFTATIAPVDNPPMQQDVLAGHKLTIKSRPTNDMINAIYSEGTFTIRTLTANGVTNFAGDNVHSVFGYAQVGLKQTIGLYDYFIFNFENGTPAPINWVKNTEYDLLTLTYNCSVSNAIFELVLDADAPVGGKFYQEFNGEVPPGIPGAQGIFYVPNATVTGPTVLAITASSNSPVCETMMIDLNSNRTGGSSAYAFSWTGPVAVPTATQANPDPFVATLASAGIYQVSVTDGNGCTATGTTTVVVPGTGACVQNETNNPDNYYPTIKQAIDAVLTVDGDVLNVPAGNWPENVVVNKDLTLNGANKTIACTDTRNPESIIKGYAGTGVTITSDGVTIAGFQIEANTGISSTANDGITIVNNKVFSAALGIGSAGVSTASLEYTIEDNCVDMTSHVFADFTFSSNPALATSQAPPGAWYTDRYAPESFTAATFLGSSRLKHSIDASDCESNACRPGFGGSFYSTQGRKFDITGATEMSIQLYVPSDWATTGRRMAGFWGTGAPTAQTFAIIEFTSDGGTPRFRGWSSFIGWTDMGLPTGFTYDNWYTLEIDVVGNTYVYTVGDLSLTVSAGTDVSLANVILQGHNTVAGVTYDIYWDNFTTNSPLVVNTNTPSVGVALIGASGANDVIIQDNSVADAFYGYLLNAVTTTDRTTVRGGNANITHTNLMQGVVVTNSLTGGAPYAPSTVGVEDLKLESFGGNYPHLSGINFQAGIYAFTGGSNAANKVDILADNISVKNTGNISGDCAGLYFGDFSTAAANILDAVVSSSDIEDNENRGIFARGARATATVNTSNILLNGDNANGTSGNNGFGAIARNGAQITLENNYIKNPAGPTPFPVTALSESSATASTIIAHYNHIDRNGYGELTSTENGSMNATCNWWGSYYIDIVDADVDGNVTFIPYLQNGTDGSGAKGFQPTATCLNPKRWYVNDNALVGDIYTSAVGNDLNQGTKRRPFLTIGKAIMTVVSSDTIFVDAGGYDEQSVVPDTKDNLLFQGAGLPTVVDFTGTASSEKTLFRISGDNTTIDGFKFKVDLSKLHMAINATDATLETITIKNNTIDPYKSVPNTYLASYGPRNAISINLTPTTNSPGGVDNVVVDNNVVLAYVIGGYLGDGSDDTGFRSGVAMDYAAGTFTRNTFQSISHDIIARYNLDGNILIGGSALNANTFNGGGVQVSGRTDPGADGLGTIEISHNSFSGSVVGSATIPGSVLRLQNNNRRLVTTVKNNTLSNHRWGMSVENYRDITVKDNIFNPLALYTTFRHIVVNTKCLSSNSPGVDLTTNNGTYTGNTFNSLTPTVGGTAISFYNHDSPATIGTYTIGGAGALANVFKKDFTYAALMSDKTVNTLDHPDFPEYSTANLGALSGTLMACWNVDVDLTNNTFDVGSGPQLPLSMNNANRVLLEAKLYHKPDASCLGKFFQTVEVMAKVFLQGPYDGPSNRMGDALRTLGDFPLAQPHAAINTAFPGSFVEVSNLGTETILPAVLTVSHADNAIVDWIWLELRDKNNPNTRLFTRSALVQRDGDIVDLDGTSEVAFPNAYQDNYYLMVRHRNHLACMTAGVVDLTNPGTMVDFTTAAQATFGTTSTSARRLIKTATFGLWAGNTYPKDDSGNGGAFRLLYNGSNNDRAPILTRVGFSTPLNVVMGYYIEDVNLNGEVKYSGSGNDRVIILNNVGSGTPLNFITQEPNN